MSKFEAKKKLLAAESEVYRQLLKLEFQTFKIYGARTKRKLTSAKTYLPLLMSGLPFLGGFSGRKRGLSLKGIGSLVLLGWKTYQRFAPMFGSGKSIRKEPPETAAEEYLSKRL
jgi:hypothetical protein